jgi:hypothetical protein
MSHPNPYLFQIIRSVWQASKRMDVSASVRSYPLQDDMDFKDAHTMFGQVMLYFLMYEHLWLYKMFIYLILSCKFLMYPVSS